MYESAEGESSDRGVQRRLRGGGDSSKFRNPENRASLFPPRLPSPLLSRSMSCGPRDFLPLDLYTIPILAGLHQPGRESSPFPRGLLPCSPSSQLRHSPAPWKPGSAKEGPLGDQEGRGLSAPLPESFFFFFSLPDPSPTDSFVLLSASVTASAWPQLTTNIIPGSKRVVKPNSGPRRARPSAALTAVSFLMLKLAL